VGVVEGFKEGIKQMITVVYDESDKDVPCICVMKADERLSYTCLKMVIGEQAELLYRALTNQSFKIKEKTDG
jgi:hypothetical protein